MTLAEIRNQGVDLQEKLHRSGAMLEALKEQCRHPESRIKRAGTRITCDCGEILSQKSSYWTDLAKIHFSEAELSNPGFTRVTLEGACKNAQGNLEKLQKVCPHPDDARTPLADGDVVCEICDIEWCKGRQMRGLPF